MAECVSVQDESKGLSQYQPTIYRDVDHKLNEKEMKIISPHFYKHSPQCRQGQIVVTYPFNRIQ
jgi:hypothetical protein